MFWRSGMDVFPTAEGLRSEWRDWVPPRWNTEGSVATQVVKSLPLGIVCSFETVCTNRDELKHWLVSWWRARLPHLRCRSAMYSDAQYAFFYVVVGLVDPAGDPCAPSNWKVVEFGEGVHPAAPKEWPERDVVVLAEAAIADLQGKA